MRINDLSIQGASISRVKEIFANDGFGVYRSTLWEAAVGSKTKQSEDLGELIRWVKRNTSMGTQLIDSKG